MAPSARRRLGAVGRHVVATAAAASERPYAALGAPADLRELRLLDDSQMMDFIGQGFLTLPIEELGPQFHAALYERAQAEFGPKNNGLQGTGGSTERIPELLTMVNSPTVAGALVSLLGPEYAHGHLGVSGCALHVSTEEDQIFHKDTQRAAITGHRTRAVMVMYYPGAADVDMGPTAIVPSSHIMARDGLGLSLGVTEEGPRAEANRDDWSGLLRYPGHEDDADQSLNRAAALQGMAPSLFEHKVVVPHSAAGSICIVHEDMVHRATPHFGGHWRPMFKFSFTRLHEPTSPSWDHDPAAVAPADTWPALAVPEATPICESLWQWHLGSTVPAEPQAAVDVPALAAEVAAPPCDGDEGRRVGAAYALGACGTAPALASLADALCSETNESARRAASHGLGAAGDRAVPTLLTVLATPTLSPLVAGSAIDALGDAAMLPDPAVVQSLAAACATQQAEIDAVEQQAAAAAAAAERDADLLLPAFEAGGMISHVNDSLQVPIMLPIACRPIAARYLVIVSAPCSPYSPRPLLCG